MQTNLPWNLLQSIVIPSNDVPAEMVDGEWKLAKGKARKRRPPEAVQLKQ